MADYRKRPMWYWIIIYLAIGAIIYGVIYFVFANRDGYSFESGDNAPQQQNNQQSYP